MSSPSSSSKAVFLPTVQAILIAMTCVSLLLAGCVSPPPRGKLEQNLQVDALGSRQLGLLVSDYANTFADAVKLSAKKIELNSTDVQTRRASLLWKIRTVPIVYTVASHEDPLYSLADLWVLAIQQRELFDRDDMSQVFGEQQFIAQATSRLLEERIEAVARKILTSPEGFARIETFAHRFAAEHPIADLSFVRDSLAPVYIDFMKDQTNLRQELATVRGYAETALSLALVGLNHAPEIARWHGELTILDAESYPVVDRTLSTMDALGVVATDLSVVVADLPVTIEKQRDAILGDIERQRVETLRDIELMRRAAFMDVARERELILAGIDLQMQTVLEAVRIERETLTGEIPAVAERAGQAVMPLTREVIDHAFWRAVQLLGLLAVLAIAAIFMLRMTHRRGRQ